MNRSPLPIPKVAVLLIGHRGTGKTFYATHHPNEQYSVRVDMKSDLTNEEVEHRIREGWSKSGNSRVVLDDCHLNRAERMQLVQAVKQLGGIVCVVAFGDLSGSERPNLRLEGFTTVMYAERVDGQDPRAQAGIVLHACAPRKSRVKKRTPITAPKPAKEKPLQILVQHHRHGTFIYAIHDTAQLHRTALKIATDNVNDVYYHTNTALDEQMRAAIAKKDGRACWRLLQKFSRTYGDYHEVDLTIPESI